jgi:uncharacterized membrane protein YkoI
MRVLATVVVMSCAAAAASAADKPMKLRDLPPAVQTAMQQETKGAVVKGYAQETEDGKVFYEVETTRDGRARDILFDPSGALVSVEEEVTLESIPAAARAAIEKAAAGGKIGMVEKVTEGGEVKYEAHVTKGTKKSEVVVKADGSPAK